jgi:putative hydrolase of the HAD superfamily
MAKKIRAVVLDFGGVMTTCAMPELVKKIVDEKGLPWQAVMNAFGKFRREYDLGDISVGEFYSRTWREAGIEVDPETAAQIEEADTASFLGRNTRTLEWMRSLKAKGLLIGILTNMPHELAPRFRERFHDYIALADTLVVSSEVHVVKPMPEIYALVEKNLGVGPDEIVFVDDSRINCEGAERAGWRVVRFESNDQVEAAFAEFDFSNHEMN